MNNVAKKFDLDLVKNVKTLIDLDNKKKSMPDEEWFCSPFIYFLCNMPIILLMFLNWNFTYGKIFVIFLMFAFSGILVFMYICFERESIFNKVYFMGSLIGLFVVTNFTNLEILGSKKIFAVIYLWCGMFVLTIHKDNREHLKECRQYNDNIMKSNKLANEIIYKLNNKFSERGKHYWWNIDKFSKDYDANFSYSFPKEEYSYANVKETIERTIYYGVKTYLEDVDNHNDVLKEIYKNKKYVFGNMEDLRFYTGKTLYRIDVVSRTEREHTKEKTYVNKPSTFEVNSYRSEVDLKKDIDEIVWNKSNMTDKEEYYNYLFSGKNDDETLNYLMQKDFISDYVRNSKVERYIDKNTTYNKTSESSTSTYGGNHHTVGYIIGETLVVTDDLKFTGDENSTLYCIKNAYCISHPARTFFYKNLFRGFEKIDEAHMMAKIAHYHGVDIFFE